MWVHYIALHYSIVQYICYSCSFEEKASIVPSGTTRIESAHNKYSVQSIIMNVQQLYCTTVP